MHQVRCLLAIMFCVKSGGGSNILGIFGHTGKSHHLVGEILFKELATRGHNVTMVSSYPLERPFPNYTDIDLGMNEIFKDITKSSTLDVVSKYLSLTRRNTELTLNHSEISKLLKSGTQFDVIILDWLFNDALVCLGTLFDAPVVLMSSLGSTYFASRAVGTELPASYVPFLLFPLSDKMNFFQRAANGIGLAVINVMQYYNEQFHSGLVKRYSKELPDLYDMIRDNVALVLSNGHYSVESARPLPPNIVPIGGFHLKEPKKLPKDISNFMDSATKGVIYFSLGSNMKSTHLSPEKWEEIMTVFSKVPYKVLCKWENEDLPGQTKNIMIKRWIPQNDVLAHPNMRLFITHGGLLSIIEALNYGIPLIGIPLGANTRSVVPMAVEHGYAVQLKITDLSAKTLSSAISEILGNPKYTETAKLRSRLLREQPMSPMDTAVFWVEHVISHKGAPHLKNAAFDLNWYEYHLFDVAFLVILIITVVAAIFYVVIKHTICIILQLVSRFGKKLHFD